MDRLNFSIPEFTRIVWTSEKARELWQPRIKGINDVWPMMERWTVEAGIRQGALQSIVPEELISFQQWCIDHEQEFIILSQEGSSPVYGNASKPFEAGKPWTYRVYMGNKPKDFAEAWRRGNNREIGAMLGYPMCCSEFFQKHWSDDGWRDLTFPMTNFQTKQVSGPLVCNSLMRHIGVRAVFHLPCSFDCDETAQLGSQILEYMGQSGFESEMSWIMDILDWPVRWSSLHGAAMITTPILKIITSTDALPEEARIDRPSNLYPAEGATGNGFPFRLPRQLIQISRNDWSDNGFASLTSMEQSHDLLVESTNKVALDAGFVLDLGCGNGLLLERLTKKYGFLQAVGVELDGGRASRARIRHGGSVYQVDVTDVSAYLGNYQLVFLSLNRLKELDHAAGYLLLRRLGQHTKYLFLYSYEKWAEQHDALISELYDLVSSDQNEIAEVRILKPKS